MSPRCHVGSWGSMPLVCWILNPRLLDENVTRWWTCLKTSPSTEHRLMVLTRKLITNDLFGVCLKARNCLHCAQNMGSKAFFRRRPWAFLLVQVEDFVRNVKRNQRRQLHQNMISPPKCRLRGCAWTPSKCILRYCWRWLMTTGSEGVNAVL